MKTSLRSLLLAALAIAVSIGHVDRAAAQSLGLSALASPALVALAPAGSAVPDLKVGVMSLIPDDALGFVVATDVLETKKEGEAVLKRLGVPLDDDDYAKFGEFLDKLEGWDSKAAHAVIVFGDKDDGEGVAFIPVTDYKKFAKSFGADPDAVGPTKYEIEDGPKGFMAEKANYAIVGGPEDAALIQRVLESKKSIAQSCEPVKSYLTKHKTALVIAPKGVKLLLDSAIDGLKKIRENIPADNPQAATVKQAFEIYDKLFAAVREEATHICVAGAFNEKVGADFSTQFIFKPDGKLAALAKELAPLPPEALAGLPGGNYIFAGAGVLPPFATDLFTSYMTTMMGALPEGKGLTPEQVKQFADAMRDTMKNVKRASMTMNFAGETMFSGLAAIYKVEDSAKFLENNEKAITAMKAMGKLDKNMPTYEAERKKIDGLDVLTVVTDMTPMLEQMEKGGGAAAKPVYQAMFGTDGKLTAYLSAVDKETVVFAYDLAALKDLIATAKAGKDELGSNVDVQRTAALLLKQPHAIGFMDVGGYIDLVKKIASAFMAAQGVPGGAFPFPIPPFPPSPPVGVAGKLTPKAVELQLVVPMLLMENTRDYVQQLQAIFGGGR